MFCIVGFVSFLRRALTALGPSHVVIVSGLICSQAAASDDAARCFWGSNIPALVQQRSLVSTALLGTAWRYRVMYLIGCRPLFLRTIHLNFRHGICLLHVMSSKTYIGSPVRNLLNWVQSNPVTLHMPQKTVRSAKQDNSKHEQPTGCRQWNDCSVHE